MVKQQVASQIKVRDFSAAKLSIEPSDAASWADVRTQLITEAKDALRSELELELASATGESTVETVRADFARRERLVEHGIDSKQHTFSATFDLQYNFLASKHATAATPFPQQPHSPHCRPVGSPTRVVAFRLARVCTE